MNISGKDDELRELSSKYRSARYALHNAALRKVRSKQGRFALWVLSQNNPVAYLEAIVRDEIEKRESPAEGDLVAVNHWEMDNPEKTKNIVFDSAE